MTIETGLRAHLIADATLAALVVDRVYPMPAPQNAGYPFVTWQRISGERVFSLGGPSGLAYPRFQIDVWSDSRENRPAGGAPYLESRAIADAIRRALDGFNGTLDGIRVSAILLDERDLFENEGGITRVSMDFRIWHEEV